MMPTIRAHLYRRLTAGSTSISGSTTLAGLVGTRVYRDNLPQQPTLPAITYRRASGPRLYCTTGYINQATPSFTISCHAVNTSGAEAVAEAVRSVINTWVSTTAGVRDARVVNEVDIPSLSVGPTGQHGIGIDVELFHDE